MWYDFAMKNIAKIRRNKNCQKNQKRNKIAIHIQVGYFVQNAVCAVSRFVAKTGCGVAINPIYKHRWLCNRKQRNPARGNRHKVLQVRHTHDSSGQAHQLPPAGGQVEIQVQNEGNFLERTMFNWAKMYSSALPKGNNYKELPQAIVINILGFVQFDCKEVYSKFMPMETTRHEVLSDKQQYHFFELPKMPDVATIDTTSEQDLWLALFNASTEEELEELTAKGGKIMGQAVTAYRSITADEQYKYLERLRDKRDHDEAQALSNAEDRGMEHMLLSAIKNNVPINLIENMRQDAGISLERLAELQQQANTNP